MNPDNYGSLPACKKLAEVLAKKGIAVVTEAAYYHVFHPADDIYEWVLCLREGRTGASLQYDDEIPAASMAEVWRELPEEIIYKTMRCTLMTWKTKIGSRAGYWWHEAEIESFHAGNPTDALIDLWIWVLEQEGK